MECLVAILPFFRKKGTAKEFSELITDQYGFLMVQLEKALKEQGFLNMNACIAYAPKEDEYLTNNSVEFHAHLGYRMVGQFYQCGYKFGRWYDMVWMEKLIGEHGANPKRPF